MAKKISNKLRNIHSWLCSNQLSLNIEKSNFVVFHPPQKRSFNFTLQINGEKLKHEKCIKYLGILIDSSLSWKPHIEFISKKIRRSIGVLSKIRHYVDINTLIQLYHTLVQPFLIYGILAWGNTYQTTLQPLFVLQKKAMRLITFSKFDEHSSPLFKCLNILKLKDLVTLHVATFMFKFHNQLLPQVYSSIFIPTSKIHNHNTRSQVNRSYFIPRARTNYGKFNIRFKGPQIWNSFGKSIQTNKLSSFKKNIKNQLINEY